jgi:galactose mutarotase-like enzyme
VFAPPGGQFICFEPMTAPANALRSGAGLRLLAPGERHRASFTVSVSDAR